ncbi:MAG: penicillin-binding protein 2 [Anaerolineaceae bacterium]|nr:penicillin-binding protein 2 [Anaerolineaceae bacterium]
MSHSDHVQSNFELWRLIVIYAIGALVFGYFLYRLFNLQIIQGAQYVNRANQNSEETISVQTQRGIITDRNGFVLARNVASYDVVITPANLPTDEGATEEIYRQLSNLIGVPVSNSVISDATVKLFKPCDTDFGIKEIVYIGDTNAPFDPVQIKCNVDQQTAMIVQEKASDWPGVGIQVNPVRDYPTGSLTSEIIGFLGPIPASEEQQYVSQGFVANRDKIGYAGVEQSLQDILAGKNGVRQVEVDVAGQIQRDLQQPVPAVPGNNVELTIDTRLQSAALTALSGEIDYYNKYLNKIFSTNGVVIAIKPKTGEILAMVSYPTYENNRMAKVIPSYYYQQLLADPDHPLLNHAVSAEYPPGSVFKMGAAIGALNEGVVTPEKTIQDPGHITIANKYSPNDPGKEQTFVCWLKTGHGIVDFLHGVAWSCDVYFYKIGGGYQDEVPNGGLGIYRLGEYAKALGYNRATGIELPGENSGLIPDPKWKRLNAGENWSTGDTYNATIGQGYVLATPLQVLMSYVTIANNGILMKPTLVKQVSDANGNVIQSVKPQVVWDITKDPLIHVFDSNNIPTGQLKTVQPWVLQELKQGLRMVTSDPTGTAYKIFQDESIPSAGKTGTAEYCDNIAQSKNLCHPGNWPAHAWYVGYAPYDNPEIVVVAFVYNGTEGSTVAAPVVRKVLDAYFELKAIDAASGKSGQ